ncbi:hypothetical protein [Candidatus Nitrosacidococcus tergens]|uniref:Secreted protein n=1 Tax=Candidatus Nitrosacidococcus tergens TaxID=553981 RepID=A0A7G1QAB8_9GAMM|nr:hypothetical protein [Candidatus Nitrosacidococcus tergens]CAB1275893.1 exported protein of unknown function [Candidatus Nitrosacidococcus tergens]
MKKINKFTQRSLSIIGLVGLVIGVSSVANAEDTTTPAPAAPTTPVAAPAPDDSDPLAPGSHVGSFNSVRVYATITTNGSGWFSDDNARFASVIGTVEDHDQDNPFKAATGYDGAHCAPTSLSVTSENLAENTNDPVVITLFSGATPDTMSALPVTGTVSAGPNVAPDNNNTPDDEVSQNILSNGQNFGCTIPIGSDSCTFTANPPGTANSASTAMNFLAFEIQNAPSDSTRIYTTLGSQCSINYSIP